MLFQLPRECRVFAKVQPATQWGWTENLLNKIEFHLATIAWQNATPSKPGAKAHHKTLQPKLFKPDFMPELNAGNDIKRETMAADVDTIKDLLSRPRK